MRVGSERIIYLKQRVRVTFKLIHASLLCVRLNAEPFSCADSKHRRAALSRGSVTHVHLKTHTENSTKTTDINYSSQPFPPLERVRWLFDLGYCLLQALRVGNAFGSTFLEGISTPPSLPARSSTLFHRTDKGKPNS